MSVSFISCVLPSLKRQIHSLFSPSNMICINTRLSIYFECDVDSCPKASVIIAIAQFRD